MTGHKNETRKKKNIKCNIITQAYRPRCSSETHEVIKTFGTLQQGEVSSLNDNFRFFFFLSSGAFLNQNSINKPAKSNKRTLIAAVFHFEDPVQNDF